VAGVGGGVGVDDLIFDGWGGGGGGGLGEGEVGEEQEGCGEGGTAEGGAGDGQMILLRVFPVEGRADGGMFSR
jgi:hypothetical protein